MNETRRTVTYVVVAAALGLVAWKLSPPVEITPAELQAAKVGTDFYADFNPLDATSIRAVGFDEARAVHQSFGVKFENGKWTIPSHHNYPADGATRLAKTAGAFRHVKRERLADTSEQYHEKFGVIDPLDESRSKLKGRGQRITLGKGEDVLFDLIIGKQLRDQPGFYYVRKPNDNTTYVAKLELDLSTKFSDWVETDLLKLNREDLQEVVIDHSLVDLNQRKIVDGEVDKLTRDKAASVWKLEGLDEATEELDKTKIDAMVSALDDLKLVGVRPKPKGLRPDLTLDPKIVRDRGGQIQILADMQSKGFFTVPTRKDSQEFRLFSNEGELVAATSKGVVYSLSFGAVFSGDESEIEFGSSKEESGKEDEEKKEEDEAAARKKADAEAAKQSSRYLLVMVQFDERYLGERPEPPDRPDGLPEDDKEAAKEPAIKPGKTKPKKPAKATGVDAAEPKSKSEENGDGGDEKPGKAGDECGPGAAADDSDEAPEAEGDGAKETKGKSKGEAGDDDGKKDDTTDPNAAKPEDDAEALKKAREEAKTDYDAKLRKYKSDLKAYEEKVEAGQKQVKELTARFGDWYYVISAESFKKLHLKRSELVKDKSKAADEKDKPPADKTSDPFPANPGDPGDDEDEPAKKKGDPADDK
jgi:hypothetical protein